jgi:hypothetical protein
MCAGVLGVLVLAFALGAFGTWWTRKTFSTVSEFSILLYGSGFFAIVTAMRSIYMLPVALLPSVALAVFAYSVARFRSGTRGVMGRGYPGS